MVTGGGIVGSGFLHLKVTREGINSCLLCGRSRKCSWKWLDKNRRGDIGECEWKAGIRICSLSDVISHEIWDFNVEIDSQCLLEGVPMQSPSDTVPVKEHQVLGVGRFLRDSGD